eukprot:COSAG06_NODE_349_length_16992_cov_9.318712_16_plen_50_part_00
MLGLTMQVEIEYDAAVLGLGYVTCCGQRPVLKGYAARSAGPADAQNHSH